MKKELSELLFPNITKDINYYLEMYPRRDITDKAISTTWLGLIFFFISQ